MHALGKIKDPSKASVWEELSCHIGGNFVKGYIWNVDRVEAEINGWHINLDSCSALNGQLNSVYTRIIAPFKYNKEFRFEIYNRGIVSRLGTFLGINHANIYGSEFDVKYVVKGSDIKIIYKLLSDSYIRKLIEYQPSIHLKVLNERNFLNVRTTSNIGMLSLIERDIIRSLERLEKLFELFANILNKLEAYGIISKT